MNEIPEFKARTNPSASHMNRLVGQANASQDLMGDGLIQVKQVPTGRSLSLNVPGLIPLIPTMQISWAVTVQFPGEADEVAWQVAGVVGDVDGRSRVRLQQVAWHQAGSGSTERGSLEEAATTEDPRDGQQPEAFDTGEEFEGWVFHSASVDPNIRAGRLVPYFRTFDGRAEIAVLVGSYEDGKIGDVKPHIGDAPFGWYYMDGDNGTTDAEGRYLRNNDANGGVESGPAPATWTTGITDHADHEAHAHAIAPIANTHGTGTDDCDECPDATDAQILVHDTHDTNTVEPPTLKVRFIQRVK